MEIIRNADGTFAKGTAPPNPAGRPKGQSLKEYWRQRFKEMTDEEKIAFTEKVGNAEIWKMAEGQPSTQTDITSKGDKIIFAPSELLEKNQIKTDEVPSSPISDSEGQA